MSDGGVRPEQGGAAAAAWAILAILDQTTPWMLACGSLYLQSVTSDMAELSALECAVKAFEKLASFQTQLTPNHCPCLDARQVQKLLESV
eukprot:8578952-Karenia_brevis.AAC.1